VKPTTLATAGFGELLAHGLERDALVGLDRPVQAPGVLLGKEALGDRDIERDRQHDRADEAGHDEDGVA
jgi:hypothetical protein